MFRKLAIAGALVVAFVQGAQAELVVNGGFETESFSGWTQFGETQSTNVRFDRPGAIPAHGGVLAAWFGPYDGVGGIFQTVNTVAGQTYDISFWLAAYGGNPNSFEFNWDGGAAEVSLTNTSGFDFQQYTFSLLATSATTDLRFSFLHDPLFYVLDDVSVVAAAVGEVPEPGSLALIGLGLAGLAAARRRRKA